MATLLLKVAYVRWKNGEQTGQSKVVHSTVNVASV